MPHQNRRVITPADTASAVAGPALTDSVQALLQQGAQTIDAVKARVADVADEARTARSKLVDRATQLVQERPFTALGVAFGAGYLAMRITTSKLTELALLGGLLYAGSRALK